MNSVAEGALGATALGATCVACEPREPKARRLFVHEGGGMGETLFPQTRGDPSPASNFWFFQIDPTTHPTTDPISKCYIDPYLASSYKTLTPLPPAEPNNVWGFFILYVY